MHLTERMQWNLFQELSLPGFRTAKQQIIQQVKVIVTREVVSLNHS